MVLVTTTIVVDYSYVDPKYFAAPFNYTKEDDEIKVSIEVGSSLDWETLAIPSDKRVCHEFEGYCVPLLYLREVGSLTSFDYL